MHKSETTFPYDTTRSIDVLCMGRVAVDLYAEQIGSSLEQGQTFRKYVGGCAGNIAVGSARQGLCSSMFSMVGTDAMGRFVQQTLEKENVDCSLLYQTDQHLTGLVLLGIKPPDKFPLIFYRENCADMQLQPSHCHKDIFLKSKSLLITGTGLSISSMYKTTHHAVDMAQECQTVVIFDLDYRPVLWEMTTRGDGENRYIGSDSVSKAYKDMIGKSDLIIGTEEEIQIAGGSSDFDKALQIIRQLTRAPIVVKKGEKGCHIYLKNQKDPIVCSPYPVDVLNVLGAGDAFMSGFLRGLLRQESWEVCGRYGNAAGALVVSRHGCAPAMPTFNETQYFIKKHKANTPTTTSTYLTLEHRKATFGDPIQHPLFILAFDHRAQFEKSCHEHKVSFDIISQFKNKIFEGFQEVMQKYGQPGPTVLIDPLYGETILQNVSDSSLLIGVPIEAAGVFPVEWIEDRSLYQQILERPSIWFVKILWTYHKDIDSESKIIQQERLQQLFNVCETLDRKLMVELIIPSTYPNDGKTTAHLIQDVYENGIYPFWWKIAAPSSENDWRHITNIIDHYDLDARVVILGGGNQQLNDFEKVFSIAQTTHHGAGFAIGRSVFWPAWEDLMNKRLSLDDIPQQIAQRYLDLIHLWNNAATTKVKARAS